MPFDQPIAAVMTRDVLSVGSDQPLSAVRRLMIDSALHHVPVVAGARLVGMLSMSDILSLSFTEFVEEQRSRDRILDERCTVEELMSREIVTLSSASTVADAARALSSGAFHSVPVVDDDGKLVGIVTTTDLVRFLAGTD